MPWSPGVAFEKDIPGRPRSMLAYGNRASDMLAE